MSFKGDRSWFEYATGFFARTVRLVGTTLPDGTQAGVVSIGDSLAGERNVGTSNQYAVGVDESNITHLAVSQTDSAVSSGAPALVFGIVCETSGVITLKDGTTTMLTITPTANSFIDLRGAKFNTNLSVSTDASATCAILWRAQL